MKHIILENNRVRLTPLEKNDFIHLQDIAISETGLLKYSPSDIRSIGALQDYIATARDQRKAYLVFDKKNNAYAGCTSYGNYSDKDSRVEIGWTWIGSVFQGSGLNKNMKLLMLMHAFEGMRLERVEFRIDERNTRSRKAVERIGAKYEGCLRNHTLMRDGYRRNTVYYGILKSEWQEVKENLVATIL